MATGRVKVLNWNVKLGHDSGKFNIFLGKTIVGVFSIVHMIENNLMGILINTNLIFGHILNQYTTVKLLVQ